MPHSWEKKKVQNPTEISSRHKRVNGHLGRIAVVHVTVKPKQDEEPAI